MQAKYKVPCFLASIILMLGVSVQPNNKPANKRSSLPKETADSLRKAVSAPAVQEVSQSAINTLCYLMDNGDKIERIGGTIAWRNNNPGCIRYSQRIADMGAIGKANGFAVFPNEETGMRAIKSLLLSDAYCNLNISSAINKYAPPHENNTARYISSLCGIVGVSRSTKLCELDDEQMTKVVHAIRKLEGWIIGSEIHTLAPKEEIWLNDFHASADNTKCIWMQHMLERSL